MNAKELNRNMSQYQELYNLDKDEFIYSILYEFAIRAATDDIVMMMDLFSISEDKLYASDRDLYKAFREEENKNFIPSNHMDEVLNEINTRNKFDLDMINEVVYEINFRWDIDIPMGYWDYHFIPSETKSKLKIIKILSGEQHFIEKTIYKEWKSRAYFEDGFIRSEIDIIEDGEHKTTEYTYHPNYKRPHIHSSIYGEGKPVKIQIDANLPKDMLELQLKKMIDSIHQDSNNILDKKSIYLQSIEEDYQKTFSTPFKQKGEIVDMLLAYDYDQIRRIEIDQENNINKSKKEQELQKVKNDTLLDKDARKIRNDAINARYGKIYRNTIYEEVSNKLGIAQDTAKKHIIQIKKLLENKDYLKFINGIPT